MSREFESEMDWSKERSLLLQRIELLQEQIREYHKREEDNKKFSDTLMTVVNDLSNEQSRNRQTELEICNEQLQQELSSMELRHSDIVQHYETQLQDMKQEIREMRREHSQLLVETERARIYSEGKVQQAEEALHERDMRIQKLQSELHQQRLTRERNQEDFERLRTRFQELTTEPNRSDEDDEPTRRRQPSPEELRASHLGSTRPRTKAPPQAWSRVSPTQVTCADEPENNMNASNLNLRRQRVQQFMKKDKQQLKLMVSTLLRAKGQLEAGGQNLSCIQERSTHRSSFGASANRTYLK